MSVIQIWLSRKLSSAQSLWNSLDMAWASNILEEGLVKVGVVKLIEDGSILSPEVDINKLDANRDCSIEDGEGFSAEVIDSRIEMSRSISVGGAFLAHPCSFRASILSLGNREESRVASILTTVPTVNTMEVASTKKAMTQKW